MARGRIRIGTSGWHYAHWVGPFYPEGTRPDDFLDFYAGRFVFEGFLPAKTAARAIQIDRRLSIVTEIRMSQQVPLLPQAAQ